MREQTFGQLVRAAREVKGWSRSDLGVELGRIKGKTFGDSKVQRLENDWQVHKAPALVQRLIEVLELDPVQAWELAYPEVVAAVRALPAGAASALPSRAVIPPSGLFAGRRARGVQPRSYPSAA